MSLTLTTSANLTIWSTQWRIRKRYTWTNWLNWKLFFLKKIVKTRDLTASST